MVGELIGRTSELHAVETFLAGPGGRVLVVSGAAGIGKTTLVEAALQGLAARADHRVVMTRAAQAEAGLAYVTLTDLLEPLLPATRPMPDLPAPQRDALATVLLRATPESPASSDPRTVGMATLNVLRNVAGAEPLVVVIDDAQWVDPASADALAFALRRSVDVSVRTILAVRIGTTPSTGDDAIGRAGDADVIGGPFAPTLTSLRGDGRVDDLPLGPVSLGVLHHLVAERVGMTLPRPRLVRLAVASGGNPLLAIEIARELAHRDEWPLVGEPLPIPTDARLLFGERLARLSTGDRRVLATIAAMATATRDAVREASASEPVDTDETIDRAIESGLLVAEPDGELGFGHPLIVDAALDAVSSSERRAIHGRLAELSASVDDRARHLASASVGPSDDVAAVLDAASIAARRRGATAVAAEWADRAASLTPPDDGKAWAIRATRAGRWFSDSGEIARGRARLMEVVDRRPPGDDRAAAILLLAQIDGWDHGAEAVIAWCDRGLAEAADAELRARLLLRSAYDFDDMGVTRAMTAVDEAVAILEGLVIDESGAERDTDLLAAALLQRAELRLMAGISMDREAIDRARGLLTGEPRVTPDGDVTAESLRAYARVWECLIDMDAIEEGVTIQLDEAQRARDRGLDRPMPIILGDVAMSMLWLGDWTAAARYADEALEASDLGGSSIQGRSAAMSARVAVDAARGDLAGAEAGARTALELGGDAMGWAALRLQATLGLVALTRGDATAALATLGPLYGSMLEAGQTELLGFRFVGDLLEAAVGAGDLATAERVQAGLERSCRSVPRPWVRVMEARGRALISAARGDLDLATEAIDAALVAHETLPMPFERARSHLIAGRIARRRKERGRAAKHLGAAIDTFRALGAAGWLRIAEAELARTGRRTDGSADALTQTEDRVARLAARGLTNREVAEAAFLTPKSVEGVLARVYGKLGIRSRAELGAWLAAQTDRESPVSPGRPTP